MNGKTFFVVAALTLLPFISEGKERKPRLGVSTHDGECLHCQISVMDVQLTDGRGTKSYRCLTDKAQEGNGESEMSYDITLPSTFLRANEETLNTGISTICITGGSAVRTEFGQPDFVVIPNGAAIFFVNVPPRRRLQPKTTGTRSVLVVRVSTPWESYTESTITLANETFGIGGQKHSFASQYKSCSLGKLTFAPATGNGITNGVIELKLNQAIRGLDVRTLENNLINQAKVLIGVTDLRQSFSHIVFCMAPGTTLDESTAWLAYAYGPGQYSYYNNGWCSSLTAKMHEVGHNLGLAHSGENGTDYNDVSCVMGASSKKAGMPVMCFNGHKNAMLGWYADKQITIKPETDGAWTGRLVGFVNYARASTSDYVLIVVGQLYIQFNLAENFNAQTRKYPNMVTVVTSSAKNVRSNLLGALSAKQKVVIGNYVIETCGLVTSVSPNYMLMSIRLISQSSTCPGVRKSPTRSPR